MGCGGGAGPGSRSWVVEVGQGVDHGLWRWGGGRESIMGCGGGAGPGSRTWVVEVGRGPGVDHGLWSWKALIKSISPTMDETCSSNKHKFPIPIFMDYGKKLGELEKLQF